MVDSELVCGERERRSHKGVALGHKEQVLALVNGTQLSMTHNQPGKI